jgi:acetylornithine deacetylase
VPAEASCVLDVRVNPVPEPQEILKRLRAAVSGEIRVLNDRLGPVDVPTWNPVVRAALAARPEARTFGSRGLSDWVFFEGVPGIKVGPGRTERSHTADEYVLESEVLDGARFYEALARQWAGMMREGAR